MALEPTDSTGTTHGCRLRLHKHGFSARLLGLPPDTLVVLIGRDEEYIVPSGGTVLQEGDTLLVLASGESLPEVRERLSNLKHHR